MQVDTGHLVDMREAAVEKIQELYKKGYEPVPDELRSVAELELMGKKETYVGLESTGSLSRWARKKREKRKKLAMAGKV
jgi:hypothetical protein